MSDLTKEEEALVMLAYCANELYSAAANNTPHCLNLGAWMADIKPGNMVTEVTSRIGRHEPWKYIGTLTKIIDEPLKDEETGEVYGNERVWVIETTRGPVRWVNCRFVRVPHSEADRKEVFRRLHPELAR
jgi:hypothetical protein